MGSVKRETMSDPTLLPKSVEELKNRFYWIQRKLLEIRNASEPALHKHPQFAQAYDKEYEMERKEQLDRLYRRTSQQEEDMAKVVIENKCLGMEIRKLRKKVEAQRRSMKQRTQRLKSSLTDGVSLAAASTAVIDKSSQFAVSSRKRKTPSSKNNKNKVKNKNKNKNKNKKSKSSRARTPSSGYSSVSAKTPLSANTSVGSRIPPPPALGTNVLATIPESCISKSVVRPFPYGCHLRSHEISAALQLTGRQSKRVEQELHVLGLDVSGARGASVPLFGAPSKDVARMYNKIRTDIITMVSLQKHVLAKQAECDRLRSIAKTKSRSKKSMG